MITIKYDQCVIEIWENADLTDIDMVKFRKLLKLARGVWENDSPQIFAELLDTLERERARVSGDLVRCDVFYGRREKERTISRLKKIEKMKSEVMKYVRLH